MDNLCLCQQCIAELPYIKYSCQQCGIATEVAVEACGNCITNPPVNSRCVSLLHYAPPVNYLVQQMKYHNQLGIADLFGKLLLEKLGKKPEELPEQIIPVPLHKSRLQQRGYNQAVEISRPISRMLKIPVNTSSCIRLKATTPQFDLPADKRTTNLSGAFAIVSDVNADHVAIIDDVMTTGSTSRELAQTLVDAGIKQVDIWTCTRASIN